MIQTKHLISFTCILYAFSTNYSLAISDSIFKKGKVVISGHISPSAGSSKVISLTYSQLAGRPTRLSLLLDSTGTFQFEFDVLQAHDATLWYEKGRAQLYIKPTDSLYVELDSDKFIKAQYPDFKISGHGAEISRDILKYHTFNTLGKFQPLVENKTVTQYLSDIRKRIAQEDSVLAVFEKQYNPSEEFKYWARQDIVYRNANFLVDYEYYHSIHNTSFTGDLYDTSTFPINDAQAAASSWYQYHLWQYAQDKYVKANDTIGNLLKNEKEGEAYQIVLENILKSELPGTGRDLICYQILFSLSERSYHVFQQLVRNGSYYVTNNELLSILQQQTQQNTNIPRHKVAFYKADSGAEIEITGDVFQKLVSMHKGKVIYIDFWATWCGPCKMEVPFAMDLHEFYKKKPIVFVNLCLFSDRNTWRKMVAYQKLGGENYFFDKDQSELLKSKLKIGGFPTYMIIDKEGKLVDTHAPRPSSRSVIKEHLSNLME